MLGTRSELTPSGAAFASKALTNMGGGIQRQTAREVERVASRAIIADAYEQDRSLITNTALQNVGALTALEQHLIAVAPLGEARYKHIVDAYALGAAQAISRWQAVECVPLLLLPVVILAGAGWVVMKVVELMMAWVRRIRTPRGRPEPDASGSTPSGRASGGRHSALPAWAAD